MASEDDDIPDSGAVFTFGKSRFADNTANKFWIRNDKAVQVRCGDDHSALVTENGRLYVFGANDWGQLGLGHTKSVNKPSSIKGLKHAGVKQIACGRVHTIALTRDGRLHSFGAGGEGQLGVGDSKQYEAPRMVEALEEQDYLMLSCGTDHSAALTASGTLYTWGGGSEGQLGHGDDTEIEIPRELSVGVPVRMVSCGYYHTALITEDKKLYTFGEGEGGKLGLGEAHLGGVGEPQHVSFFTEPVDYVSCGNAHTAAITEKGHVYTFGNGASGQLGHGPDQLETNIPKRVARLEWTKCKWVSCGECHTAVITVKGCLYTFGDGRHGKLAQGEESFSNVFIPSKVRRFNGFLVEEVSCGGCHTLVRARRRAPPSDPASDSEPEEVEPKFKDPVLGANLAKLANNIDLNGSLGGTARIRRRQREPSPLPPLSRTLPPLAASTPKSRSLPPMTLKPLNDHTIPKMKLRNGDDEADGPRGGGDEPDFGKPKKQSDVDSAMEDDEESEEEEREVPKDQDPFATTHFSKSGTKEGMKPLIMARSKKQPPKEEADKPNSIEVTPLDRRKKPEKEEEKEEESEEEESEEEEEETESEEEEEEEETQPKKGKITLSMMAAAPKSSSSKAQPKRTVEEEEDNSDGSEEERADQKSQIKMSKPPIPAKRNMEKKPAKKEEEEEEEEEESGEEESEEEEEEEEKNAAKKKDMQTKDSKAKPGTSKKKDDEDDEDDEEEEEEEDNNNKDKENKPKKEEAKSEQEDLEPKAWQFWKKKKKPESPATSTASPTASTTSTNSTKKTGDQGGSKACIIL